MDGKRLKRTLAIVHAFLLTISAFAILNPQTIKCGASPDLGFYVESNVTFVNDGSGIWNLTQEDRSWSLFMNNSWQTVCLIDHTHPLETVAEDEDGNKLAVVQFQPSLLSGENVSDHVVYHVRSKPRSIPSLSYGESGTLADVPDSLREKYCNGHGFWMIDNQQIRERSLAIAGNENRVLALVSTLVSWIWQNIRYKSHYPTLYPNETLFLREGDCDEQAILLGTFCRVLGIPSQIQTGCIFQPQWRSSDDEGQIHSTLNQIVWHGWAIVYVPPWGWLPVDLTYVMGSQSDPLNAVRAGAVTSQYTVQSMNVSENDYLTSDRAYENLLERNNFSLYSADEMDETSALLGDLNGDSVVNIIDLAIVAKSFGSRLNDPDWSALADVNKDERVDIVDISIVAMEYGKRDQS